MSLQAHRYEWNFSRFNGSNSGRHRFQRKPQIPTKRLIAEGLAAMATDYIDDDNFFDPTYDGFHEPFGEEVRRDWFWDMVDNYYTWSTLYRNERYGRTTNDAIREMIAEDESRERYMHEVCADEAPLEIEMLYPEPDPVFFIEAESEPEDVLFNSIAVVALTYELGINNRTPYREMAA